METQKRSKKVLRSLINDSMREAISSLQLPEPSSKIKKLLERSSKKLAGVYSDILKKEEKKKKKKAEKQLRSALNGEGRKKKKQKPEVRLDEPVKL